MLHLPTWRYQMAQTTRLQETPLLLGIVACCWPIIWSRQWLAPWQGATCWFPPLARTSVPAFKDAYFLCSVNEKSFWFLCMQEGGRGGVGLRCYRDWTQMLSVIWPCCTTAGHMTQACYLSSRTCWSVAPLHNIYVTLYLCFIQHSLFIINNMLYNL